MAILTSDEIDRLLSALREEPVEDEPPDTPIPQDSRNIKIYDFKRPDKFTREHILALDILHETFARSISSALTSWLKTDCYVHVCSVDQIPYNEFIRSIPTPTTLAVIDLNDPKRNQAVIEIDPVVSFALIGCAFGGIAENTSNKQRELTRMEWVAARNVLVRLLGAMRESWASLLELMPQINYTDTNPQLVSIVSQSEMTVLITLEVRIAGIPTDGLMNILYPSSFLEGIKGKLSTKTQIQETKMDITQSVNPTIAETLAETDITVNVELGKVSKPIRDILRLSEGAILELDKLVGEPVDVKVNGVPIAKGEVVVIDENFGVRVTEIIRPAGGTIPVGMKNE